MVLKFLLKPSVYGRLIDRYLFNFRIDPKVLSAHLSAIKWLKPRIINGCGVVSFCLLNLEGVTLWPLPLQLGFDTTSCAYRCAVIDESSENPEPSVYVLERNTNLPIVARFGSVLFSGAMKMIHTTIEREQKNVSIIRASFLDGQQLFSAKVSKRDDSGMFDSKLFGSLHEFVDFIKGAASSYTPSIHENHYSRVDLAEDSNYYEPVDATIKYSWLDKAWPDANLAFDSAFRAGGGRYRLRYLGSVLSEGKDTMQSPQSRIPEVSNPSHR